MVSAGREAASRKLERNHILKVAEGRESKWDVWFLVFPQPRDASFWLFLPCENNTALSR